MKSMNKVQLIGYLGSDPVIRQFGNGQEMAQLRLATDEWLKVAGGEPKKHTQWHSVSLWNQRQIQQLKNYLMKGSHVLVEGKVVYRHFTDKHGVQKHLTEIKAHSLVDLDR
jgi:single-strand DNA-binding protein